MAIVSGGGVGLVKVGPLALSGTSLDVLDLTAAKRLTVTVDNAIATGANWIPGLQIGDAAGVKTAGYLGACSDLNATTVVYGANFQTGWVAGSGGGPANAKFILTLVDEVNFIWDCWCAHSYVSGSFYFGEGGGRKVLTAELDRVRIMTSGGASFTQGTATVLVER